MDSPRRVDLRWPGQEADLRREQPVFLMPVLGKRSTEGDRGAEVAEGGG